MMRSLVKKHIQVESIEMYCCFIRTPFLKQSSMLCIIVCLFTSWMDNKDSTVVLSSRKLLQLIQHLWVFELIGAGFWQKEDDLEGETCCLISLSGYVINGS